MDTPVPRCFRARVSFLGFLPQGVASLTLQLVGAGGTTTWPQPLTYSPVGVPEGPLETLPTRVAVSWLEFLSPGYTFLSVRRRANGRPPDLSPAQRSFGAGWGMLVAAYAGFESCHAAWQVSWRVRPAPSSTTAPKAVPARLPWTDALFGPGMQEAFRRSHPMAGSRSPRARCIICRTNYRTETSWRFPGLVGSRGTGGLRTSYRRRFRRIAGSLATRWSSFRRTPKSSGAGTGSTTVM